MEIVFSVPHIEIGSECKSDCIRILNACRETLNHNAVVTNSARYSISGRCAVWSLSRHFGFNSREDENAYALRALLDCLIQLNQCYLTHGGNVRIPKLYKSGVFYKRTEVWDTLPALYERGYGDCKSLTAALVTEYLEQGIECIPVFRFTKRADGKGSDYHILVLAKDFEDPSKVLGMGKNEVEDIR